MTTTGKNRIMIFGPKTDGTYVVEFRTAKGEALAISIPRTEAAVIRPGTHAHWGATWAFEPLGPCLRPSQLHGGEEGRDERKKMEDRNTVGSLILHLAIACSLPCRVQVQFALGDGVPGAGVAIH